MNKPDRLSGAGRLTRQVQSLHSLARIQRGLRIGLRALWLGSSGALLAWGVNTLWGWLPDQRLWALVALLFALPPLVGLAAALTPSSRWVWRLDRLLGLREQVSTAWEVASQSEARPKDAHQPAASQPAPSRLSDSLIADVVAFLPQIHERMLARGWFLEIDLAAALIILLLSAMVLASGLLRPYSTLLGDPPPAVAAPPDLPQQQNPAPQEQPQPGQPQPGAPGEGAPGQEGADSGEQPANMPGGEPGGGESETSGADMGAVAEALRELGSDLSRQAGTYDLGQALENLDMEGAAEALEDLQGELDELSEESLENMAESLNEAAGETEAAGEQDLADAMRSAAQALQNDPSQAEEPLDEMAGDLRDLAQALDPTEMAGSGSGAGDGQGSGTGPAEPLTRLPGEGGEMDLPLDQSPDSGLLNPAPPGETGDNVAQGSLDSTARGGADAVQSPLLPNTFPWKWRDVVSQFFER